MLTSPPPSLIRSRILNLPGDSSMIRILGTILAALLGLAFGSFLNVCLSRWPEGESVVKPRSHCRRCGRTLAWWENIPLVSWIALPYGCCRTCDEKISWRYPLVELAVGRAVGIYGLALISDVTVSSCLHLLPRRRGPLIWLGRACLVLDSGGSCGVRCRASLASRQTHLLRHCIGMSVLY